MIAARVVTQDLPVDGRFGWRSTMVLQSLLASEGFPPGPIDGRFGRQTKKAVQDFLTARGYDVGPTGGWCGWPRQTVKALQSWAKDQGANPGPIDGWWGARTTCALQIALNTVRANGMGAKDVVKSIGEVSDDGTKAPLAAAGVPLLVGVEAPESVAIKSAFGVTAP